MGNIFNNNIFNFFLFLVLFLTGNSVYSQKLLFTNSKVINERKQQILERGAFKSLKNELLVKADSIIKINYWPRVTNKKITSVSNDIHDYVSMATYYWPNPKKKDGLPYIGKDGKANPEVAKINNFSNLVQVSQRVKTLGLAYFYTNDEKYAKSAASLINVFFLREDTRMNPNFEHAQFITALNTGRLVGIIEARFFIELLKGVELLKNSSFFSEGRYSELQVWFTEFLNWMENSEMGRKHKTLKNNIETSFHLQRIAYASFIGDRQKVINIYQRSLKPLLQKQFTNDGKQPLELKRKRSDHYSIANLMYWLEIEKILSNMGILFDKEDVVKLEQGVQYLMTLNLNDINAAHARMLSVILSNKKKILNQTVYQTRSALVDSKVNDGSVDQLFINLTENAN